MEVANWILELGCRGGRRWIRLDLSVDCRVLAGRSIYSALKLVQVYRRERVSTDIKLTMRHAYIHSSRQRETPVLVWSAVCC